MMTMIPTDTERLLFVKTEIAKLDAERKEIESRIWENELKDSKRRTFRIADKVYSFTRAERRVIGKPDDGIYNYEFFVEKLLPLSKIEIIMKDWDDEKKDEVYKLLNVKTVRSGVRITEMKEKESVVLEESDIEW